MFTVAKLEPKPLRWWMSQHNNIDTDPPYQRHGRLWSKADKAFLIDSILNNYDIPKIYMVDFTFGNIKLNKKGLPYAIIDGKQRLESMFDFFSGTLVLDDEFVFQQNPSLKLSGLGYTDLSKNYPDVADIFNNFPLSVIHIITDEEEKINELFVRLNRSKPLTGAEIRNAMTGPLPNIVRLIANHELFKSSIKFTITRAQDKNAATKLLLFEYRNQMVETKRSNLDKFTDEVAKESKGKEKIELASRRVFDTLDRMSTIFLPKDPLLKSAGAFPVFYWLIRETHPKHDQYVREFLNDFEKKRKENREDASDRSAKAENDIELATFDRFNRSTDDQRSYVERHRILENRFKSYLKGIKQKIK
jgi:hypothetical protein